MAIFRGAGGPGDATTDAANEASVASTKAAEAEASATAAASSAISASNSATTAINSKDAAATSESNAVTSALAASTSEANAANSETNASDSESNAATSETNAANSASSALTSKNAAAISEANASTSETNSSASASAASTSAASAAASYDGFDDRYLGAKSTDPTVDNDNDPLITGALYFNTTSNDMKVYNGSAWEVTFATLSGALVAANNLSDVVDVASSRTNLGLGTTDNVTFNDVTATGNIAVTGTVDGRDVATDGTKLDGIEASATADQTGAEIKAAYELEANAFTDAQFTKLAGIETSADVTDTTNVTAAGAVMDSELTSEASVKALDQGVATTDSPSFAGLTVDTNTLYVDSTNNRVGIGTSSPAEPLDVIGTIKSNTSSTGDFNFYATSTGGGAYRIYPDDATTANPTWLYQSNSSEDQAWVIGGVERMRLNSSGNVGIGTTSPLTKLVTVGTTMATSQAFVGSVADTSYSGGIINLSNSSRSIGITSDPTNAGANSILNFYVDGSEAMRIDSSGNVLIGATATASTSYGAKFLKDGASSEILAIHRQASDGDFIQFARGGNASGNIKHSSGNLVINAVNDFQIETNDGTNAVHIDTTGNVGIGTSSPAVDLDIENSDTAIIQLKDTGDTRSGAIKVRNGDLTLVNGIGVSGAGTERAKIVLSDNSFMSFDTGATERMRITSAGNVGIGTTSPAAQLDVVGTVRLTNTANASNNSNIRDGGGLVVESGNSNPLYFYTGGSEKARITSTGDVGIGTTSPAKPFHVNSSTDEIFRLETPDNQTGNIYQAIHDASGELARIGMFDSSRILRLNNLQADGEVAFFTNNSEAMRITSSGNVGIGTGSPAGLLHLSGALPRIYFTDTDTATVSTFSGENGWLTLSAALSRITFNIAGSEKMRIDGSGNVLVGKTSSSTSLTGFEARSTGFTAVIADNEPFHVERKASDGVLIRFRQNGTTEGFISVNGTVVSYNGGHLARWSQLADNTRDETLFKGTVMTNLDQMAEWTTDGVTEDNEQLNCMAVSSVEGDPNVAGVFVNWDNDDDVYTNDMNIAMTGDMIIRIAAGTTVTRGNLLMSAGDGTAKPQGDDIVRSKTIAKVTSTHVTCTYDDGSYCVPCVLMAC